tara:strand:+ start:1239 stop:1775 length:537 start_codon:yes stop_codon:yes gene_type:complete
MKIDDKYELDLLFDSKQINKRVLELAEEINSHYNEQDDLIVICVLHGSVFFCSDLTKVMHKNITLDTVRVKSYSKTKRRDIKIINDISIDLEGKKVLIVEDIVDTGQTVNFLYKYVKDKKPKNVKIVSFLFKPDVYKLDVPIDWVGFEIENHFVVGYGLDYDEKLRNLNEIYRLVIDE